MQTAEKAKSILEMGRGAIMERVDYEMAKVIENILDENTKATGVRELTVKIKFTPDDKREVIKVDTVASSKLQPTNSIVTALYLGKDQNGDIGAVEMVPQIPGQTFANGTEQETPAKLKMIKTA